MAFVGKLVGDDIYVHLSACEHLRSPEHQVLIRDALTLLPDGNRDGVNVAKVNARTGRVSLLEYIDFSDDPFPKLRASWSRSRPDATSLVCRSYESSANPPILHRKELLVAPEHSGREEWSRTTRLAEELGLLEQSHTIGFLLNWERAIEQKGYRVVGKEFHPIGNVVTTSDNPLGCEAVPTVQRHLTALARTSVSAPVQLLLRHGLLERHQSFFDYGCGRGGDVETLSSSGFDAAGWDPYYAPNNKVSNDADVVNLGFVINVIEDPAERVEALHTAFRIAKEVIAVGVMLYGSEGIGRSFGDGVLTSRGTFQKYFSQDEFKDYLEQVLHQEAFMVAPGIGFVFADKDLEQRFVASRYRTRSVGARLLLATRRAEPKRVAQRVAKTDLVEQRLAAARPTLERLWQAALELGRYPELDELPEGIEFNSAVPTLDRARRLLAASYDAVQLESARHTRTDDLRLYFAAQQFVKRPRYRQLEARLQLDIKAFFGDYAAAQASGIQLLKDAASSEKLLEACRHAAQEGLGWLDAEHSLQLHISLVERLPVVLRAYVACAMVLVGGMSDAVLVKIHIASGKLTLIEFDDFDSGPLPRMTKRVKVNLKAQSHDVFEYGEQFQKPLLYRKSRYLHEEAEGYAEQLAFDDALEATGVLGASEFGPAETELASLLERERLEVSGMKLVPSNTIPDLDAPCGGNFTYRRFIECGETQHRTRLSNRPRRAETYNALHGLATHILDPLIEYFGAIRLTYGFCSHELGRQITTSVAPELDQHAAHEVGPAGKPICKRGGAACDFIVEDEDMREVASWVMNHLPFDRLYFYAPDRPLHVSWSPNGVGEAYELVRTSNGRKVPRRLEGS